MSRNLSDEYLQWLTHPYTKSLLKDLGENISSLKDNWAEGVFTSETSEGTAQKNAKALGHIEALLEVQFNITQGGYEHE